jgi:hypothetical protein
MKLESPRQMFGKYSNMKFHVNPSSWNGLVPRGRTDRHEEINSRLSQFCEHATELPLTADTRTFLISENYKFISVFIPAICISSSIYEAE